MFSKEYREQIKQNYEAQLGILEPVRTEIEETRINCTEDFIRIMVQEEATGDYLR